MLCTAVEKEKKKETFQMSSLLILPPPMLSFPLIAKTFQKYFPEDSVPPNDEG